MNYAAAVTSSIGVVIAFKSVLPRLTWVPPGPKNILNLLIPFFAVAGANFVNVFMMRRDEMQRGIPVTNESGQIVGTSKEAGKRALFVTSLVRIGSSFPMMFGVPLVQEALSRVQWLKTRPRFLNGPVYLSLCWSSLMLGLPLATAAFPAMIRIPSNKLEPQFHHLKDSAGNPMTLLYNRGQ